MKTILRHFFVVCSCLALCLGVLVVPASATESAIKISEHNFSLTLPEGTVLLDQNTASKEKELIESFGYTVSSFKNYLTINQIILFAADPQSGLQISVKTWDSDFALDTIDLAYLSDETLDSVASKIVTAKGAEYKTVSVGSLRWIEIRTGGTDSGGDFSSVQYVTIRNGAFYSVNVAFSGKLDDAKVQTAWDLICSTSIKSKKPATAWDVSSIFEMILIWALILLAIVAIIIVILSFVKDIRFRRTDHAEEVEYIERRNRK